MGAFKNHEFLHLMEQEAERERMEFARREQQYINSRKAQPAQATKTGASHKNNGTRK